MAFAIDNGFAFNSYVYGDRLGRFREEPIFARNAAEAPGFSGGYAGISRIKRRMIELGGTIHAASHELLRDEQDDLLEAHAPGYTGKLLCYNTRWLWAQVDGGIPREHVNARQWDWTAQLVAEDPHYYDETANSTALTSAVLGAFSTPRTGTVTAAGTAPAAPVISIVVDSHATSTVLIENLTTDEVFEFDPAENGTFILHTGPNCTATAATNRSLGNKFTLSGTSKMSTVLQADFMQLAVGANSIRITGAAANSVTFAWHNRYL
jgi:hypothetical protein